MRNQISFHSIESNRWYAGGRWKRDESRPDAKVIFGHPTLSEPLCGWDWYKSHYDRPYEDSTLEISFDDKQLAKIESWGYKRGVVKDLIKMQRELSKEVWVKYGRSKFLVGYEDDINLKDKLNRFWGIQEAPKQPELVSI